MGTSKSSIYRWDFPWNKSSSYWATPILWKPPVVIQESAQTQTLFVIAFIGSLDDLTLFVPMLVGKGCLTMTRAGTGGATGKLHQMLLSCAIDIYIYILMYNIIYIYLHSNIYIYMYNLVQPCALCCSERLNFTSQFFIFERDKVLFLQRLALGTQPLTLLKTVVKVVTDSDSRLILRVIPTGWYLLPVFEVWFCSAPHWGFDSS